MTLDHITAHFTWEEAACHDGTPVPSELRPNAVRLANTLERIRAFMGYPLVCVSWYRTPVYNERVGGAKASQHMMAWAADIRPPNLRDLDLLQWAVDKLLSRGELTELGGLGVYPAWLHVDLRPRTGTHIARWQGAGVGSEG